jgi:hypothetical protein
LQWKIPPKHFDVPNAYARADTEEGIQIYVHFPAGIDVDQQTLKKYGVTHQNQLVLLLNKSLYGLKQAGRMWNQMLSDFLLKNGLKKSMTDKKDLGTVKKFLGIKADASQKAKIVMDQKQMIMDLLKEYHMENAHATRLPIGQDYDIAEGGKLLPEKSNEEQAFSTKHFQSLVGSLLWIARCTRPDIISLSMRVTERRMRLMKMI